MHLNVPALDLQVSPLGRRQDMAFGAGVEAAGGTGEGDFLVGGGGGFAALALQADLAAGGVEVDAGFGVGFVFVAGFADGEEGDSVFNRQAEVALGDEVGVVAGGDAEVFTGSKDVVLRGELGDAGRGAVLDARFGPGGDGAGTAQGGFDGVTGASLALTLAGGGAHDFNGMFEGFAGRELGGLGVAFESGVLFGGDVGQALRQAVGVFGLGNGFAAVEVGAAGVGPGVAADQEAASGADGAGSLGGEFCAVTTVGLAGVVGLLFEVAELQAALVLGGAGFDAGFAGGVVEDELVVTALPGFAGVELLRLEAGEAGVVGVGCVFFAGEEGRGVGAGLLGAAALLVALGVGLTLAVVDGADDQGSVDVAVLEGDKDFLPGAGREVATPIGTGNGTHDAQPDAERIAGRAVVGAGRVFLAGGGEAAALPGELDADASVTVGVGRGAGADDDGGEGAVDGRARVDVTTVAVGQQGAPGDAGADGGELVAVEVDGLGRDGGGFRFGAFLPVDRAPKEALLGCGRLGFSG